MVSHEVGPICLLLLGLPCGRQALMATLAQLACLISLSTFVLRFAAVGAGELAQCL